MHLALETLTHRTCVIFESSKSVAACVDDAVLLPPSPLPFPRMWSGKRLLHDMKHVERREQDERLACCRTAAVRRVESAGVGCRVPAAAEVVDPWPGSRSLCLPLIRSPDYFFFFSFVVWGQRDSSVYAAAGCRCVPAEEVWTLPAVLRES